MSLTFGALTSDFVNHGSGASLDNLDPLTFISWLRATTFTNNRRIYGKGSGSFGSIAGGAGGWSLTRFRATTNAFAQATTPSLLLLNTWQLIAGVFDSSVSPVVRLYIGSLSQIAIEASYTSQIDGSGAVTTDAAAVLSIGNRSAPETLAFQGDIAIATWINAALTLNQIRAWQFRTRKLANASMYSHYGFNGTGSQADWSGNGNAGVVTGATVNDHVPLGPAFGYDLEGVRALISPGVLMYHRRKRAG